MLWLKIRDRFRGRGGRSGVRTPWAIIKKKLKCFLLSHETLKDAGAVMPPVRGSRPIPLLQCPNCGEFFLQRTGKNAHVKAVR